MNSCHLMVVLPKDIEADSVLTQTGFLEGVRILFIVYTHSKHLLGEKNGLFREAMYAKKSFRKTIFGTCVCVLPNYLRSAFSILCFNLFVLFFFLVCFKNNVTFYEAILVRYTFS